jgi:hypothetical protein
MASAIFVAGLLLKYGAPIPEDLRPPGLLIMILVFAAYDIATLLKRN